MTSLGKVQPFILFFFPTQLNFLSLNVLFVNEKTALISTNDFIVFYKEKITYQS